jgi:signal transduction histidine kinase
VARKRRPLLTFGILLLGPAAGLSWLAWRSVDREEAVREKELMGEARAVLDRVVERERASLKELVKAEDKRPYYQYAAQYMPPDVQSVNGPAYVASPVMRPSDDPRVLGWFQWSLSQGVVAGPELFGADGRIDRATFLREFGGLKFELGAAPKSVELRDAIPTPIPLLVVAANEEAGQLIEEVQVANAMQRQTARLENFQKRTQQQGSAPLADDVRVRSTPFTFREADDGSPIPLVAWRLVWIPGQEAKARRDAPTDRWLLQGLALSPGERIPGAWSASGSDNPNVILSRDPRPPPATASAVVERDLLEDLDAVGAFEFRGDVPILRHGPTGEPSAPSKEEGRVAGDEALAAAPRLPARATRVRAAALVGDLAAARSAATTRFFLLLAGLVSVVGVGFFVLLRSVRREVETARRKEDFVAAVTHELKTPLAGIRMYADMLQEGWVPEGETPEAYAGRIVDETKRLGGLVDRVLELAAFDRGVATFRSVPSDLGEVVRAAAASIEPQAAEAGVPVRLEIEDGLPLVPLDASLARQIAVNLLDNAVKYSARAETKDVRASLRRDGDAVALVVADRGVGVAAADKPRLFQPFHRGGREETRTARGVGLGLALVKRYADAHGAKVTLDSEEGKGTTVTVRFPVRGS